jgi:hypothetical protein
MTDKVIIYTKADGTAAICIPAPAGRLPNESELDWLDRVAKRSIPPDAKDVRLTTRDAIPTDRTFRDAWIVNGHGVAVDMPRARDVHRGHIRRNRVAALRALDAAYQKASDAGDTKAAAAISAHRQKWRDAPAHPDIDAAKTPDQLKAVRPA